MADLGDMDVEEGAKADESSKIFTVRTMLGGETPLPERKTMYSRAFCSCNLQLRDWPMIHAAACYLMQKGLQMDLEDLYKRKICSCCMMTLLGDQDGPEEFIGLHVIRQERGYASSAHQGAYIPALKRLHPDVLTYAVLGDTGFHTSQWHAMQVVLDWLPGTSFSSRRFSCASIYMGPGIESMEVTIKPKNISSVHSAPCRSNVVLVQGEIEVKLYGAEGDPRIYKPPSDAMPLMCIPSIMKKNDSFIVDGEAYEMVLRHGPRPGRPYLSISPLLPTGNSPVSKTLKRYGSCVLVFAPETSPSYLSSLTVKGCLTETLLDIRVHVPLKPKAPRPRPATCAEGLGVFGSMIPSEDGWLRSMPLMNFLMWLRKDEEAVSIEAAVAGFLPEVVSSMKQYTNEAIAKQWAEKCLKSFQLQYSQELHAEIQPETYTTSLGPGATIEDTFKAVCEMVAMLLLGLHGIIQADSMEESYSLASLGVAYKCMLEECVKRTLDGIVETCLRPTRKKCIATEAEVELPAVTRKLKITPSPWSGYSSLQIQAPPGFDEDRILEESLALQVLALTDPSPRIDRIQNWVKELQTLPGRNPWKKKFMPPLWMQDASSCPICEGQEECEHSAPMYMDYSVQVCDIGQDESLEEVAAPAGDHLACAVACLIARSSRIFEACKDRLRGKVKIQHFDALKNTRQERAFGERRNDKLLDTYKVLGANKQGQRLGQKPDEALAMTTDVGLRGEGHLAFLVTGTRIMEPLPSNQLVKLHESIMRVLREITEVELAMSKLKLPVRFHGRILAFVPCNFDLNMKLLDELRLAVRSLAVREEDMQFHRIAVDYVQKLGRPFEIYIACQGNELLVPVQARRFNQEELNVMTQCTMHECPTRWRLEVSKLLDVSGPSAYTPSLQALLDVGVLVYVLPNAHLTLLDLKNYNDVAPIGHGINAMTLGKLGIEVSKHARSVCSEGIRAGEAGDVSRHAPYAKATADSSTPMLLGGTGIVSHRSLGTDSGANLHNMDTPFAANKYSAALIPTAVWGCVQADEDSMPLDPDIFDHQRSMQFRRFDVHRNLQEEKSYQTLEKSSKTMYEQLLRRNPAQPRAPPKKFVEALEADGLPRPGSFIPAGCCLYLNVCSSGDNPAGMTLPEDVWVLDVKAINSMSAKTSRTCIFTCTFENLNIGQKIVREDQKMVVTWLRGHLGPAKAVFNCGSNYTRTTCQALVKGLFTETCTNLGLTLFPDVHREIMASSTTGIKRKMLQSAQDCYGANLSMALSAIYRHRSKTSVLHQKQMVHGETGITWGSAVVVPMVGHMCKHKASRRVSRQGQTLPGQQSFAGGVDPIYRSVLAARKAEPADKGAGALMCMTCGIIGGICVCEDDLLEVNIRSDIKTSLRHMVQLGLVMKGEIQRDDSIVTCPKMNLMQRPESWLQATPSTILWRKYHEVRAKKVKENFISLGPGPLAYAMVNAVLQLCRAPRSNDECGWPAALSGDTTHGNCLEITMPALRWALKTLMMDCQYLLEDVSKISGETLVEDDAVEKAVSGNLDGSLSWRVSEKHKAAATYLVYGGIAMPVIRAYLLEVPLDLHGEITQREDTELEILEMQAFRRRFTYILLADLLVTVPIIMDKEAIVEVDLRMDNGLPYLDALDFYLPGVEERLFGTCCFLGANPYKRGWSLNGEAFPAVLKFKFRLVRASTSRRKTLWDELRASHAESAVVDLVEGGPSPIVNVSARWSTEISPNVDYESKESVERAVGWLLPEITKCCSRGVGDEAAKLKNENKPVEQQLRRLQRDVRWNCDLCGQQRGGGDCRLALMQSIDIEDAIFLEKIHEVTVEATKTVMERMVDRDAIMSKMAIQTSKRRSHRLKPDTKMWHLRFYSNEFLDDEPLPAWPINCTDKRVFDAWMERNHKNPYKRSEAALKVLNKAAEYCIVVLGDVIENLERDEK